MKQLTLPSCQAPKSCRQQKQRGVIKLCSFAGKCFFRSNQPYGKYDIEDLLDWPPQKTNKPDK